VTHAPSANAASRAESRLSLRSWPWWVLVAASGAAFFSVPVADNDLWGHVYFGREILSLGRLPAVNQYSYTAPSYPWINHEILAECAFAAMYQRFGAAGLLLLKLALGLGTLGVMARTALRRTRDPVATTVALVLAASLMSYGYLVRPQIFSFLALAIVWDWLDAYARDSERPPLWLPPILFTVWINTHGGVMAGIAVLLAFSALSWWSRSGVARPWDLTAVAVASACALLLNPYGWKLPAFLLGDLLRIREISEWAPIPVFEISNLQFKLAVVLCAFGALRSTRRALPELAIVGLVALATFRHERHLPIFAILATPHLAATMSKLAQRIHVRELSRGAVITLAAAVLAIAALQASAAWRLNRDLGFQIYLSREQFPVDAVRYIERAGLSGNLALSFDWGEYAIWHLYPSCRVSIDGRYTTAYPSDVIERSWRFMTGAPGWDEIIADATIALVDRRHGVAGKLAAEGGWREVHADPTALVFVREETALREPSRALEPQVGVSIFP
jgi:hypothetical protein